MASNIQRLVNIEVRKGLQRALDNGLGRMNAQLDRFGREMERGTKGDMLKIHREVAKAMRKEVVDAYDARVGHGAALHGRIDRSGRNPGALRRAISRQDLALATSDGIEFINEGRLSKEAAHWRRINFGAGEQAGAQPGPVPLRIFGETVGVMGLGIGASPAFILPKGFFIQGGRAVIPQAAYRGARVSAPFVPSRRSPYTPAVTAGIRGQHFLEVGLDVAARELPLKYSDLLTRRVNAAIRRLGS